MRAGRISRGSTGRSVASIAMAVATSVVLATAASATAAVTTRRLQGTTRYGTAESVATTTYASATVVVLASGQAFPDALAASYLAGRVNGPVLLTTSASLSPEASAAINALGASGVEVVGGPLAVSDAVVATLRGNGRTVERIAGATRYETAQRVATQFPGSFVGGLPGGAGRTAIVTTGENFADALAGGPVAFARSFPILLTTPTALSPEASAAMDTLGIQQVLVLGGTQAVSDAVAGAITAKGIAVQRVSGADRQETATKLADLEVATLGWAATHTNIARGDDFPDALAAGPHAGKELAPILLTFDPDTLGASSDAWLRAHASTLTSLDVFGGIRAITDATVAAARTAAGG